MPIQQSDLKFFLTGGASNADPNLSLGGTVSNVEVTDNNLHNLFDKTTGAESTAGDIEYRCIYLYNDNDTLTLQGAKVWVSSETSHAGADLEIGLDLAGVGEVPDTVANENTAPDPAVTFDDHASEGAAISIGDIPPNEGVGLWIERTIGAATAAKDNYTTVLSFSGDTSE